MADHERSDEDASSQAARASSDSYRPEGISAPYDAQGADGTASGRLPTLGWRGWLRWTWRQLTSMRVALILLMALAVVAVPGSVLPQRNQDPAGVVQYFIENPRVAPWLDRLGFFEMYTSVWFSSIYILLFISLVGCIVPRTFVHARVLRRPPPKVPVSFQRFPARAELSTTDSPEAAAAVFRSVLRKRVILPRYRVVVNEGKAGTQLISAERGYLRETGNLLFHLALVGLLICVALGQLLHYRAQIIVTEGTGFANSVIHFANFEHGAWFDEHTLDPFTLTLDSFHSEFTEDAQARNFVAEVTVEEANGTSRPEAIKVNHPLNIDGVKIYLMGNGFAPRITVRDADGEIAFSGTVPFIAEDSVYTSRGVIKVPDVSSGEQIGLQGYFLPTAYIDEFGAVSLYPQPVNPLLILTVYTGDLGLDGGIPQNVYELYTDDMTQALDANGQPATLMMVPGQTVEMPDGLGTVTFESLHRFAGFDLRYDPLLPGILLFSVLAISGLIVSLFTPRRRVWLRITRNQESGLTMIDAAGLARGDDLQLQPEIDRIIEDIKRALPATAQPTVPGSEPNEGR